MEYLSQIQEFISTAEPEMLLLILVGVLFVFLLLAKIWAEVDAFHHYGLNYRLCSRSGISYLSRRGTVVII